MSRAIKIQISPEVLRWLRKTSGATVEDAAKRAKVAAGTFDEWERRGIALGLTQARTLAAYFKRPLSAFLLPTPASEPDLPRDFRTLPSHHDQLKRETRLALRKAARLQSVARELMRSLEQGTSARVGGAELSDDPSTVAAGERERLGVSWDRQREWQSEWEALRQWRSAIELCNVLVFQFPIPVEDVRGFSLGEQAPWVIAVSSSDAVRARIFTLFHEWGHLLLHNAGMCTPRLEARDQEKGSDVEQWCNRFAGAFLVPSPALHAIAVPTARLGGQRLHEVLAEGAKRFKVSQAVMLFRLLDAELISKTTFRHMLKKLQEVGLAAKLQGGPVRPAKKCISQNGTSFSTLVLEARNRGVITYADVSDFLSVRLKHLPEIESLMSRAA